MLLHFYQRPHIITWTGSLFFVTYLFVHADLFSVQISAVLGAFCTPAAIAAIIQVFPLQTATKMRCLSADEISALQYVHSAYSLQILTEIIINFSPPKPKKFPWNRRWSGTIFKISLLYSRIWREKYCHITCRGYKHLASYNLYP